MTTLPTDIPILIIGAGPSGLMMAAQLLRNGVHPIIIDSKTQPTVESRALVLQARSLEIFRQLGLDKVVQNQGNKVDSLVIHQTSEKVAQLDASIMGESQTPFPYVLILEQSKTERILIDYLTANACPIYWNTEVLTLDQSDNGVTVEIRREGETQFIRADWVIGADGASSMVRKELGIAFKGGTYKHRFYLADVRVRQEQGKNAIHLFLKNEGFVSCVPRQGDNLRFMGVLPKSLESKNEISFQDVRPYLTYTLDLSVPDEKCTWFSVYQLHHRVATTFRAGRCFLIGDAAHVHSPVAGQSMNTGLQDAHNLGWKLAGVVNKRLHSKILSSYVEERVAVARRLLRTTDTLFTMSVSQNWFWKKFRDLLLPQIIPRFWREEKIKKRVFSMLSQADITYRNSSLTIDHSSSKIVRAGDRIPHLSFYDEKLGKETDLHSWCAKTGFTLLVIGHLSDRDLFLLAKWITSTYPRDLNFYYLPPSEKNKHVFEYFEVAESKRKALVIRPDMHIGYLNDAVVIEMIDTYLTHTVGLGKNG